MSEYVCLLITLFSKTDGGLFRVALKIKKDALSPECMDYPLDFPYKQEIHGHLPAHVPGDIVEVQQIFDVEVSTAKAKPHDA